jgi:hypothetical protein
VRIGTTILSLMLVVGLSMAAQTAATNAPANAGTFSSLLRPSTAALSPGSSPQTDPPGDTLHVDLEAFNNAIGLTAGGTFYSAARLTATAACTVKTVIFYKWDVSNDNYLFVWGSGTTTNPGPLIESMPYTGSATMTWVSINLTTEVPLGVGEDIWVGPKMSHSAGTYPLGTDDGPHVATRGDWINYQGSWIELFSANPDLDVNWHIRAILGHGARRRRGGDGADGHRCAWGDRAQGPHPQLRLQSRDQHTSDLLDRLGQCTRIHRHDHLSGSARPGGDRGRDVPE